ncbi:hypothetical protein KAR91_62735 [Candidatus Pacearchaeota archaeon]|nr:hypothetical protein [Candidatus Pacearchaeota archaeon]
MSYHFEEYISLYTNRRQPKEGTHTHTCTKCKGSGNVVADIATIHQACEYCGGDGQVDWVAACTPRRVPPKQQIVYNCVQQNTQQLVFLMKQQFRLLGVNVAITIEELDPNPTGNIKYKKLFGSIQL